MQYHRIILGKGKEKSLQRFHPWIFSGAIESVEEDLKEGDIVDVISSHSRFLARGYYQIGSIAVRVLSFEDIPIDANFWIQKVQLAYQLRQVIINSKAGNTNTYRLIHGEGDGAPGLIVDIYHRVVVIQCHTVAIYLQRNIIMQALVEVLGDDIIIYNKSEKTMPFKAQVEVKDGYLRGKAPQTSLATENGLQFYVDWERGQKTGFFLDQRDNRALLERYSQGRDVLNVCSYTGGFSLYAMRGEAHKVHSIDSSGIAIELAVKNIALNFPNDNRHTAIEVDAFKYLDNIQDKYDLIILDPPAFAKHKNVIKNALQGYRNLNAKALKQIKSGGILFTFSCSQVISVEQFRTTLFSASALAGRKIRILHQLHQGADHPVDIFHPEGEYLKGLVLFVE